MDCLIARLFLDAGKSHSMELDCTFFFRQWEVPTCIFSTVAFNRILGAISTLILFLNWRRLILSLE